MLNQIFHGDCRDVLQTIPNSSVDLIYLDPPFFTQRKHSLSTRDNTKKYEFDDKYNSLDEYLDLIRKVLAESKRTLKQTGSLFLHCDKTASHYLRVVLDQIFGTENFQSEIVWSYKRWSNSKKGLLNSHQIIFFYSKSEEFKFKTIFTNYSPTTNLDQILQERERNEQGKSAYKKNSDGDVVIGKEKKGVPLSDVWEIPYLNPKAKERSGYPTQKPVLLINQILTIASDEGDTILDPFCGSGTTCVSAKLLNRNYLGIDISADAVSLTNKRLDEMIITDSNLLNRGIEEYSEKTEEEIHILEKLNAFPVQRNSGIDGFLKDHYNGNPVPIKIQKKSETLEDAIDKLEKASKDKKYSLKIVVQTNNETNTRLFTFQSEVKIIKTLSLQLSEYFLISSEKLAI